MTKVYGIIGRSLGHSFSPEFFASKFKKIRADAVYRKFEIGSIEKFSSIVSAEPNLVGLNVTIPYKKEIIPYLDAVSDEVKTIGAVNTVLLKSGKLYGYNTDVVGFKKSFQSLNLGKTKCLVLGTGGAAQSVYFVLDQLGIEYQKVSRGKSLGDLTYKELDKDILNRFPCIINTTPLGMAPNKGKPDLPYRFLSEKNTLVDLVYQPRVTPFLEEGLRRGTRIKNGFEMLISQAEASWEIWQTVDN